LSLKYCLLATEGPNDQAAIGRLLQLSGFKKFDGTRKDLNPFWEGFIPIYPKGGNLYTRMDMPSILTSSTHSVAIHWGEGDKLIQNITAIMTNHKRYAQEIHAFGLIVDADEKQPDVLVKEKAQALKSFFPAMPEKAGDITTSNPRTGIYVLPDNKRSGVLDSVLVDCASIAYPDHKNGALRFLNDLDSRHTNRLNAGARNKAVVGCIANIIQPGQSNTSSIAQNEWISEQTIKNGDLALLQQFLKNLWNCHKNKCRV